MSAEILGQIAGILGALTGVAALLAWFGERRKRTAEANRLNSEAIVAERSVKANVDMTNTASLQAQLAYLEKIIENVSKHNDKLQEEIEAAEDRERKQTARIRELEEEVSQVRKNARTLQEQCDHLERKLNALTSGDGR